MKRNDLINLIGFLLLISCIYFSNKSQKNAIEDQHQKQNTIDSLKIELDKKDKYYQNHSRICPMWD